MRCYNAPALCLNINSENYFCQQWAPRFGPAINCSDSYRLANPGQTISARTDPQWLGRKEDSPGAPLFLLHHLDVAVAKRSRKTRDRRGWTSLHPLDWQDGFACPIPIPKRGQSRFSFLALTSSWQRVPCRSVLGLRGHYLHCLLNKVSGISSTERTVPHVTSDVITNIKNQEFPGTGCPAGMCYLHLWRLPSLTWLDQASNNLVWSHSWHCSEDKLLESSSVWHTQTNVLLTIDSPASKSS